MVDSGSSLPPESIESKELQSFKNWKVNFIKLSRAGIIDFTNTISKYKVNGGISQADYGDIIINKCILYPENTIRDLFLNGANLDSTIPEIMALCIGVNPEIHPRKSVFIGGNKGVVISTSKPLKGFNPITSNPLWDFPCRTIKYSESSFLSLNQLIERNYKIVRWNKTGLFLAIKSLSSTELEMLMAFRSQLNSFYYRKAVGMMSIGHYFLVKEVAAAENSLNPVFLNDWETIEQETVKELYALVIQQNPSILVGASSRLPFDLDENISLEDKNQILKDIEQLIEDENNEEPEDGSSKVFTTETTKKKEIQRVQKQSFDTVKISEIMSLSKRLKNKIFGQEESIDKIVNAIKRAKAGLSEDTKPIITTLLVGQTGSGKTLLAKLLAEELIKDKNALIRIDCSEYGLEHEAIKLTGSPPSYVGHEEGGVLTNKVIQYPFCVILFDEVEKAHPRLYDVLLQVFDDARLTDGKGRTVNFSQALIIMTSNLGSRELDKEVSNVGILGFNTKTEKAKTESTDKIVIGQIKKHFRPEFMNRIDEVIVFRSLDEDTCKKIVSFELGKLRKILLKKGYRVNFDYTVVNHLIKEGFSKEYGARALLRLIKKDIMDRLADEILSTSIDELDRIVVSAPDGNGLMFTKLFVNTKETQADVNISDTDTIERLLTGE